MKLTACRATETVRPVQAVTKLAATVERGNGQPWPFGIEMLEKCQTSLQTEIILKQLEILRKVQPKLDGEAPQPTTFQIPADSWRAV